MRNAFFKFQPYLMGALIGYLVLLASLQGCLPGQELLEQDTPSKPVRFELRLADTSPSPGAVQAKAEGSEETLYLAPEVVLTNADVRRSRTQVTPVGSYGILVELTHEGGEKLAKLTRDNLNKRVAILLDGRLVMAPVIRSEIPGGSAIIEGDFTEDEARELARGIQASRP